jgi:hypothetical protein
MTVLYRVLPRFRRRFAPFDGESYPEVGPGETPEYVLVTVGQRVQRIPRSNFERVEVPLDQRTSLGIP